MQARQTLAPREASEMGRLPAENERVEGAGFEASEGRLFALLVKAICATSVLCGMFVPACVLNPQTEDPSLDGRAVALPEVTPAVAPGVGLTPPPGAAVPGRPEVTPGAPVAPAPVTPGAPVTPAPEVPPAQQPVAPPSPTTVAPDSGTENADPERSDAGIVDADTAAGE